MTRHRKWLVVIVLLLGVVLLAGAYFLKRHTDARKVYVGVAEASLFEIGITEAQMFKNDGNAHSWSIPFGTVVEVCELKGNMVKVSVGPKVELIPSRAFGVNPPRIGWMRRYDLCLGSVLKRRRIDGHILKSPIPATISIKTQTGEYFVTYTIPFYFGLPNTKYRPVWLDETCIGYTCNFPKDDDEHSLTYKENVIYYLDGSDVVELSILPKDFKVRGKAKEPTVLE